MAKRKKLGFSPAVHRERTANALYNARAGVASINKAVKRRDCDQALAQLTYTARQLGAAHAEKAGARNTGLRKDSFRTLNSLKDKVKVCYRDRNKSSYERNNEP